ncbi:MAG: NAD(P)H-dependent glycerol-3-phosphate dehydrogenase [Rickettsiales bacterium]|jgi:glycerol-3-phosphate dehydrogenase (NAD(P)+)|nr:NAD(P)H-dependent glycerol-3-phosphate dehydrogenase [Rickettsiales bacterium]
MDRISVIGAGRWGSFLAWYAAKICGLETRLYGRATSPDFARLKQTRKNEYLALPDNVELTSDLPRALDADLVIIAVGVQNFRALAREIATHSPKNKTFLLAMKGLETPSAKLPSQIAQEELPNNTKIAILAGPGHVQDYVAGIPSCAVLDSPDAALTKALSEKLSSRLIRFYYGRDFIGNQVGAALKNVVGIAAGILDGLGWQGLKGGLMTRAPVEVGRLIKYYKGDPMSAYGLAHLGDYEATLFSEHSHNRMFGELFARGEKFDKLAEGAYTLQAVANLAETQSIDMPIVRALHSCISKGTDIKTEIRALFDRDMKAEF